MIIYGWNGRGMGNDPAVRGLLDLRKKVDPDVLFLSETKMDRRKIKGLRWKLDMPNMLVKDSSGQSGGLAMFWKRDVKVQLIGAPSRYHIDTEITEQDGFVWRFTGIYGEPKVEEREKTWKLLRTLKHHNDKPWLCVGDFNEILYAWEKEGGAPKPQAQMDKFKQALEDCDLRDLEFTGDTFTWRNHSSKAENYIRERLDRAVATDSWCARFPAYKVVNGDPRHSDHRPVIVETHGTARCRRGPARGNNSKFEARWLKEDECESIVKNAWGREVQAKGEGVKGGIKGVLGDLMEWSRNVLGDLEKRISRLKKELEGWRRKAIRQEQTRKEEVLRFKLCRLEEQKEMYWKQRAHAHWMRDGDRNTKYFHSVASERKKTNKIMKLRREDGVLVEEEEAMKEVATNYFSNLFTSSPGGRMNELLNHVDATVTEPMNEMLCKEFNSREVIDALDSIGDLKAPGPDGMHAIFYKRFWEVVGEKVTDEVLGVLNGGPMPTDWNDTCVVLIPKVNSPESMKDLRPISLCNVAYKLISKVMANRLKQILPEIISPNQSAFVPGRLITDNILLAYECTHMMKTRKRGRDGYAAIKLDMSKAYDRVEWSFIEGMMRRLGFAERWINLVMTCMTTVQYQIRVNGSLSDVITLQRGLRQGDPLSPTFFLYVRRGF
jgi:exonuclease III